MICSRCGTENSPRAKFCQECAAPLPGRCAQCAAPLPPAATFCPECAHPAGVAAAGARYAAPDAYTPRHLDRILTSRASLEGERPSFYPQPSGAPLSPLGRGQGEGP